MEEACEFTILRSKKIPLFFSMRAEYCSACRLIGENKNGKLIVTWNCHRFLRHDFSKSGQIPGLIEEYS